MFDKAISYVIFVIVVFLIGCFVEVSFDINKWREGTRILAAVIYFLVFMAAFVVNLKDDENDEDDEC